MSDIKNVKLMKAQKEAGKRAIELNKALGLSYYTTKGDDLYEMFPDGTQKFIKKVKFGLKSVSMRHLKIR